MRRSVAEVERENAAMRAMLQLVVEWLDSLGATTSRSSLYALNKQVKECLGKQPTPNPHTDMESR